MQRLPLNPRLSRDPARGRRRARGRAGLRAAVGAALSAAADGHARDDASDLLTAIDRERDLPPHVSATARRAAVAARIAMPAHRSTRRSSAARCSPGYPDRVARRRAPGSPRVLLASGHGAVVGPESGVRDGEFLVALDVTAGRRGEVAEARIRMASAVDRGVAVADAHASSTRFDPRAGVVRAVSRDYYDAIAARRTPGAADPDEAARLLVDAFLARPLGEDDEQLAAPRSVRRTRPRCDGARRARRRRAVARSASSRSRAAVLAGRAPPARPSWRPTRLPSRAAVGRGSTTRPTGSVVAAVKLQELFGLADTPRVGPRREPVLLSLLAPNGRPVQMTRDLRSFWERTYPEVRKELRGRYPRHPWPEDPWTAPPTAPHRAEQMKQRGVKPS